MNEPLLQLRALRFDYGDPSWSLALDTLDLGAQRVTAIIGPNGSGKSTLLRLCAGLSRPGSGDIRLAGKPIMAHSRREVARMMAFLPQETPPLFDYCVGDVVAMGRYVHARGLGAPSATDSAIIDKALTAVDLTGHVDRPLSQLSGGERRRALIASVLAQEPRLLLLDEPTNSLDLHHAIDVMRQLCRWAEAARRGVIIVTHDLNLASLFAERLIVVHNGRITLDGPPESVMVQAELRTIYGPDILIHPHPQSGRPLVLPTDEVPT